MVTLKVYIMSEVILHQRYIMFFFSQRKLFKECCKFKQHHDFFPPHSHGDFREREPRGQLVMFLQDFGSVGIQRDI